MHVTSYQVTYRVSVQYLPRNLMRQCPLLIHDIPVDPYKHDECVLMYIL